MKTVIHIEPLAPSKPPPGNACNGCGVCCLAEPCPVGMVLSRRRSGRCRMLRWDDSQRQYRCGVVSAAQRLRQPLAAAASKLASRWIGAGQGCDCSLEVDLSGTGPARP